jgi:hypothetical protein
MPYGCITFSYQDSTASDNLVCNENTGDLRQAPSRQLATTGGVVLREIPITPTQRVANRVLDLPTEAGPPATTQMSGGWGRGP